MRVNRPVEFPGTAEERLANYRSHCWTSFDPEEPPECAGCACKAYHVAGDYPCGVEPPRETVETVSA